MNAKTVLWYLIRFVCHDSVKSIALKKSTLCNKIKLQLPKLKVLKAFCNQHWRSLYRRWCFGGTFLTVLTMVNLFSYVLYRCLSVKKVYVYRKIAIYNLIFHRENKILAHTTPLSETHSPRVMKNFFIRITRSPEMVFYCPVSYRPVSVLNGDGNFIWIQNKKEVYAELTTRQIGSITH